MLKTISRTIKSVLAITLFSSPCSASLYLKGYVAGTENNFQYQNYRVVTDVTGPTVLGHTEDKIPSSSNLMTSGMFFGIDSISDSNKLFANKFGMGIELGVERQFGNTKFTVNNGQNETPIADIDMTVFEISNNYQANISLVFTIAKSFYIKAGPTVISNEYTDEVFASNIPRKTTSLKHSEDIYHWGGTIASGVRFNVNKWFGLYSEYSSSFFQKKKLHLFNYQDADFGQNINDLLLNQYNKKLGIGQGKFQLGFIFTYVGFGNLFREPKPTIESPYKGGGPYKG